VKNRPSIYYLFQKFIDGSINKLEYDQLIQYFGEELYDQQLEDLIRQKLSEEPSAIDEEAMAKTIANVDLIIGQQISVKINKKKRIRQLYPFLAAAVMLVFGICSFFYWNKLDLMDKQTVNPKINDILPGTNQATITLEDGTLYKLNDKISGITAQGDHIRYADGSSIILKTPSSLLSLTTPRGGTYQITLPDGTKVWLNADSKLDFPVRFANNSRSVSLKGEAYFEVTADAARPFVVQSSGQKVTVLGTHFNINAYDDELAVTTTLLEGSVRIDSKSEKSFQSLMLYPGQQSIVTADAISMEKVDPDDYIDWKNGKFVFSDESIASIMRKVARWYDVDVVFEGIDQNEKFWGSVSRFENVIKVLENLELTGGINFEIKGRTIFVKKLKS